MTTSRRSFLAQASSTAMLGMLAGLPAARVRSLKADDLIPEADDALLRKLAAVAIDVARSGGASFADVRVSSGRTSDMMGVVNAYPGNRPSMWWMSVGWEKECGVRVIVDNAWGFSSSTDMTPDGVAEATRTALARARASRPRKPYTLALAPAARVENGTWASPMAADPFTVPLGTQAELVLAALYAGEGVKDVGGCSARLQWFQHTRVFASSEGSLTTQRFNLSLCEGKAAPNKGEGWTREPLPVGVYRGQYGYEAVSHFDLVSEMKKTAERAVERANQRPGPPSKSVEVGRYDIVFGARPIARILADTIGEALNLERALGYKANTVGTSFAAPPDAILGQYQLGSPLLNVRADRTRPHAWATAAWDDEGVKTGEHDLIKDGVIVDYLTSRETAAEIGPAFVARPGRAQGHASGIGAVAPTVRLPNMTLVPSKSDVAAEDLIADVKRGFYVQEVFSGGSDQQLLSAQYSAPVEVREIRNGTLGDRIEHLGLQFTTPQFWKSVTGVGGPKTLESVETELQWWADSAFRRASRFQLQVATVSAVPVRVRDVNVLNLGRTA